MTTIFTKSDLLNLVKEKDAELVDIRAWKYGTTETWVVPKGGKFYQVNMNMRTEEGWFLDDEIEGIEVETDGVKTTRRGGAQLRSDHMTRERISQIEEVVWLDSHISKAILNGERDNYDGADGARYVRDLCEICRELLHAVKNLNSL